MSAPLWMPFFLDKYLGATGHLNTEQHGAYLLLIIHYWQKAGLPGHDDDQLRQITRLDYRKWRRHREVLKTLFGSNWTHPVIDQLLRQAFDKSRAASANARLSHQSGRRFARRPQSERSHIENPYRESSFVSQSERINPDAIAVSDELARSMATKR